MLPSILVIIVKWTMTYDHSFFKGTYQKIFFLFQLKNTILCPPRYIILRKAEILYFLGIYQCLLVKTGQKHIYIYTFSKKAAKICGNIFVKALFAANKSILELLFYHTLSKRLVPPGAAHKTFRCTSEDF